MRPHTVGSLFSGIGGFDLGFERAGFEILWQVEIDPFCRAVLAKHWPDVRRYEDVRQVGGELENVDVVCGGFPCQDVSECGARAGLAGAESGLWGEMRRVVRFLRPGYVVVENVTGLFDRGFDVVLGDLAALGFDAEWATLSACAFGAPHTRERLFIVAYADEGRRRASGSTTVEIPSAATAVDRRQRGAGAARLADWPSEPGLSRVADGVSAVVDRGAGLGNAIVPQIAEWVGRRILEADAEVTSGLQSSAASDDFSSR